MDNSFCCGRWLIVIVLGDIVVVVVVVFAVAWNVTHALSAASVGLPSFWVWPPMWLFVERWWSSLFVVVLEVVVVVLDSIRFSYVGFSLC